MLTIATIAMLQGLWIAAPLKRHQEQSSGVRLMAEGSDSQSQTAKTVRLIFEYEGDQVRLISQQLVDMAITGADIVQTDHSGFYVESRSTAGEMLARVAAHNVFSGSAEVFPQDPAEPITRVDVARPKGAFTVLVPAPAAADHVTLVRITAGPSASRQPGAIATPAQVTDVASFPLTANP